MKQKIVTLVLGLTLTATSLNVFAEESSSAIAGVGVSEETNDASTEEAGIPENFIWGEVVSIDTDEMIINILEQEIVFEDGLSVDDTDVTSEDGVTVVADETTNEEVTDDAGADADENTDAAEDEDLIEEQSIIFTEDTTFWFASGDTDVLSVLEAAYENEFLERTDEISDEVIEDVEQEDTEGVEEEINEDVIANVTELTEAALEDLLEGDSVAITLDDEGNAEVVMIVLPEDEMDTTSTEDSDDEEVSSGI